MATSRLAVYNKALRYLGERRLASVTENSESRRAIEQEYDDAILMVLEAANWNFAIRAIEMAYDPGIAPQFGYSRAYAKPDDWIRTVNISANDSVLGIHDYRDENGRWHTNIEPIYVRYVSSDGMFGGNLGLWTPIFAEAVASHIAMVCCERITQSDTKHEKLIKIARDTLRNAIASDNVNEPPRDMPMGRWAISRLGSRNSNRGSWR